MRVLVCGTGAEDARSPVWGHVVASLTRSGHSVWSYDPEVAVRHDRTSDPLPALAWVLTEMRPELVLVVDLPAPARKLLAQHGMTVQELTQAELHATCHVELFATDASTTGAADTDAADTDAAAAATEPEFDVVVAGRATRAAVTALVALHQAGYSVQAWGDEWQGVPELHGRTSAALPFPLIGQALRRGRRVLAVGPEGPRQLLEAGAAGRPALTVADPDQVVWEMELPPTAPPADIPSWTAHWKRTLPAPRDAVSVREYAPRVSFFVPTYNNARYLEECVDSVLAQTVDDVELILLNDGSTDKTASLLAKFESDPRVRTMNQANVGQRDRFDFICRRTVDMARGEFLAALGSDDVCAPDRVETQLAVFDAEPETQIVLGGGRMIGPRGEHIGETFKLWYSFSERTLMRHLAHGNFLAHPTMMCRASVHDVLGPLEEGFSTDVHLWWKAAGRLRFRYLPRHLVDYRHHRNGSSTNRNGGHLRGFRRGRQVHHLELTRRGLPDIYPELRQFPTAEARAAAGLDLANRLMRHYPETAVTTLEQAAAELGRPHPALLHNLALATLLAGDAPSAMHLARRCGLPPTPSVMQAFVDNPTPRALLDAQFQAHILSPEFADALNQPTDALMWDGMPEYVHRVLVVPHHGEPQLFDGFLRRWAMGTRPDSPMALIIPTLGSAAEDVVGMVLESAQRAGVDLDNCADICIEGIDSLNLLPPDYLLGAFLLEDEEDLAEAYELLVRPTALPRQRQAASPTYV